MIEFADMATYVAAVETSSISQAALRLGIVKSVASRRIRNLEQAVGVTLLDRAGNRIRPTEVGAVYYAKCARILEAIESAQEFVSGHNNLLGGRLRVSASAALLGAVLAPLLAEFAHAHPSLTLDVDADDQRPDFQSGGYDVAFREGRQPDSGLLMRAFDAAPFVICASPGYLEAHGRPAHPRELETHQCLLYACDGSGSSWTLPVDGEMRTLRVRERLRSTSRVQLAYAAIAGLGLLLSPRYVVEEALADGRLLQVLDDFLPPADKMVVLYPESRRHSKKVQALIAFLGERLTT
ncbi:LysR family transcriptional regulator [Luteibacter sp. Lutesp34]|uniref:LysR family transcriptional regulator n=1 Tax=Luteibacter sp. Lutesp34 TaxID=3243030 RepID=UPI0039B6625A